MFLGIYHCLCVKGPCFARRAHKLSQLCLLQNTSLIVVRKNPSVVYDNHATVCGEKNSIMTVSWTNECNDTVNDTYFLIFEFGIVST